ncbi:MAG: hypothetical protein J0H67_14875 [Rhodospirillales bacterium]|nr:hypothetical protein [Rhodospirillales bacterium]
MEQQNEDPDDAVARLESALERIAARAGQTPPPAPGAEAATEPDPATLLPTAEIASRLDHLIDRLRAALANKSG